MANVAFDADLRLISITTAPDPSTGAVEVDVGRDLYSEAKRQWLSDPVLIRVPFPFRTVGGDPLSGTLRAGSYFFLNNIDGWRIRPYPADHEAVFIGNLYREDVNIPLFSPPPGSHAIAIRLETSSLTQMVDTSGGSNNVNVTSVGGIAVSGPDDFKADTAPLMTLLQAIHDVEYGRWVIEDDGAGKAEWVVYGPDNVTELARFELDTKAGRAIYGDIDNKVFIGRRRK